jgi:hypothetical protein
LRGEAVAAGVADAFDYPGFVPAYIRPLFCRGNGPFRWAVLSGDPADIATIDDELRRLFPDDAILQRWLSLAPERVAFQGLPARICWLGYGDRARAGLAINDLVRSGQVRAPVVIGRDHLDSGSVASPYRETEAMRDGSDAIADWPILNALLNTAAGATWVSVHHGGGVGIGNSIHAGMVVVADGTDDAAERLERVLTTDPGTGILRHADAGYDDALERPRRFEPVVHGAAKRQVEVRPVGTYPGAGSSIGVALTVRVDVEAADHVIAVEHRVREAGAVHEVARVPLEVAQVLLDGHLVRPAPGFETRARMNVVDGRGPRGVVPLVVLGPERLQDELGSLEPEWHVEVGRHELGHATDRRRSAQRRTG